MNAHSDVLSQTSRPTVLILGANGRIGHAATRAFDAAGWQVLAQVRRRPETPLPGRAVALPTAIDDTTTLAAQARGARLVIHALNPRYDRWAQEAMPLLDSGIALAERLQARLLLPGNVYAYGEAMPARVDTDTPRQPSTPHGRIRLAMEQAIERRSRLGSLRATVLTAGDFFGAGRGSWFDQAVVSALAKGRLVYPGPTDVAHAWAYLPDLAATMVALAQAETDVPFERLLYAGITLTGSELLDAVERAARALSLVPPTAALRRGGMPWSLIRAVGIFNPTWRALAQMSYLWRVPHTLDDAALRARIGTPPSTPLPQALRQALLGLFPAAVISGAGSADVALRSGDVAH